MLFSSYFRLLGKSIPSLKDGDNILLTKGEKAQKLVQQFESAHNFNLNVLSPIEDQLSIEFQNIVEQQFSSDDVFKTDQNEIKSIIKKLKKIESPW